MTEFKDFNLNPTILKALESKGFKTPSEIQEKIIPVALERKHDIIGIAQTGTGKTAAFGLPIIEMLDGNSKFPKAIILAPTRELAIQVSNELETYKGNKKINSIAVYGGAPINGQIRTLNKGVDIVVGTPGRVLDLINRNVLRLEEIEQFVLDEADEMLNMGFIDDIETILASASGKKRVLLFSATMPAKIKSLSKKYMKKQIIIEAKKKETDTKLITQINYILKKSEKVDAISRIIDSENFFYGIIFCRTKADVDNLTKDLKNNGYDAECIHGDVMQSKRERILKRFKDLKCNILVATDVAARGIDVDSLTHVINYSMPQDSETYVHRIGRTGRAGKKGTAISFITPKEKYMLREIEKLTKSTFEKVKLPNQKDIEVKKQEKFYTNIQEKIETGNFTKHMDKAKELIKEFGAEELVATLLNELQGTKKTPKVEKTNSRRETFNEKPKNRFARNGDIRLFIAKGKMDNFNKGKLLGFLEKESGISRLNGKEVKICEKFSFATVSQKNAERIIETFENRKGRPLVEVASN